MSGGGLIWKRDQSAAFDVVSGSKRTSRGGKPGDEERKEE
jgi:hypothetical protein